MMYVHVPSYPSSFTSPMLTTLDPNRALAIPSPGRIMGLASLMLPLCVCMIILHNQI